MRTRGVLVSAALAVSSILVGAAPAPASSASASASYCTAWPNPTLITFTQVYASGSGACRPSGTVQVQILRHRAPYNPVVVATGRCTSYSGRTCTARATSTRIAGSTYSVRVTALANP